MSLNIRDFSRDSVPPVLVVQYPTALEGFNIFRRDSAIAVSGYCEDPNGRIARVTVNGVKVDSLFNGKFLAPVSLAFGKNTVEVRVYDKNSNVTSQVLTIIRDPMADVTAPVITLLEPVAVRGFQVVPDGDTLRVRWTVRDQSSLHALTINGQAVDSLGAEEFIAYFNPPAPDSVTIRAVDLNGNLAVKQIQLIRQDSSFLPSDSIGVYHALLIAVQQYRDQNLENLSSPIKDARALESVLLDSYAFERQNIQVLENPDRRAILRSFDDLSRKLTSHDNLLVFYAGHGQYDKDVDQGYWLPSSASLADRSEWISNGDIRDHIKAIKAKHVLLMVDACFAGSVFEAQRSGDVPSEVLPQVALKKPSRKAITSGGNSPVPDRSVFIRFTVETLKSYHGRVLQSYDLYYQIRNSVKYNTPNHQTPRYGSIIGAGDEFDGDFVFVPK